MWGASGFPDELAFWTGYKRAGAAHKQGLFITPPEVANTGTRFLTGGPGAAPGDVASKNGWGHMRVRGESISYSLCCLCDLCVVKMAVYFSKKGCAFTAASRGMNSAASS